MGGIESLVDLDAGFADDEEYDEVCSQVQYCLLDSTQPSLPCPSRMSGCAG